MSNPSEEKPNWKPTFPTIDVKVPVANGGVPVSVTSFLSPDSYDIGTSLPLVPEMEDVKSEGTPTTAAALLKSEQPRYGTWQDSEADGLASPTTVDNLFQSWPNSLRQGAPESMLSALSLASGRDVLKSNGLGISCKCSLCQCEANANVELVPVRALKPRFIQLLRRQHPTKPWSGQSAICTPCMYNLLLDQISCILEEDQDELTRFQDQAMKTLGEYEHHESNWQKQFDGQRSFGEKAADAVARFGGSWKFLLSLIGFIAMWALLNLVVPSPWDPYPFILLNLFLSMLAGFQAPIIMMSQNRQAARDRQQTDYVSTITLRSEHQVRHINAKLDHLLNHQWRRLLEIQDIQLFLMEARKGTLDGLDPKMVKGFMAQMGSYSKQFRPVNTTQSTTFAVQCHPDGHSKLLLRSFFGKSRPDDVFLFSHWHHDGENFSGKVTNVIVEYKKYPVPSVRSVEGKIKTITYDLTLSDSTASLDDIFSGDQSLTLRNDFDLHHMAMQGTIKKLDIVFGDESKYTILNGQVPPRYKPAFAMHRSDKVTEFWKRPVSKITIVYQPPAQAILCRLEKDQVMKGISVQFFSGQMIQGTLKRRETGGNQLLMLKDPQVSASYLENLALDRPFEGEVFCEGKIGETEDELVQVDKEIQGPCVLVMIPQGKTRVSFNATVVG